MCTLTYIRHGVDQLLLWESAVLKFTLNKPNGFRTSYIGRSIKYCTVAVVFLRRSWADFGSAVERPPTSDII